MKTALQFKLSQQLALTPQLQQSIRLLQLSTLELNQEIEQMLAENPLLERDDDPLGECHLVVVSLYDGAAVRAVMAPWLARSAPGRVVVDTSTVDPATTESLAGVARARGLAWLDAPISGSSVQTARGEATVLIGGPAEDVAALGALWEILGGHWHHVGPTGSASRMKLVTNLVLGLNRAALAEGLVLADVLGIDAQAALDVLRDSPAASRQMETKGPKMVAGDFSVQARLGQHLKDVDLILEAAADAGVTLTLATAHRALLEAAVAAGLGDLGSKHGQPQVERLHPLVDNRQPLSHRPA